MSGTPPFLRVFLPLMVIGLGVGGFVALRASKPQSPPVVVQEPAWRVDPVLVELRVQSPSLTLTGQVESPELTRAAAPGVGRIARVAVREGAVIVRGEALLEMDARDFLPRVAQARGQVEELQAAIHGETLRHVADLDQLDQERRLLDLAAADVVRFERLQRENFYSAAAVDQSRSNLARQQLSLRNREFAVADHKARLAQLEARRLQAEANLDQAQLAAARRRVVALFDGYVAKVNVAAGDQVNAGQTLLELYPRAGLEVRATLPAPKQASILAQLAAGKTLLAEAEVGGKAQRFRLVRTAAAADTRGLDGFFRREGGTADLRVGSLLSLRLQEAPVPAIAIPYTALYGGNQVYRIRDGRLEGVTVRVLGESVSAAGVVQLLIQASALKAGERLLATHLPNAVTGLKVLPTTDAAAGDVAPRATPGALSR